MKIVRLALALLIRDVLNAFLRFFLDDDHMIRMQVSLASPELVLDPFVQLTNGGH